MPRPQAQGRPGTRVIPKAWEAGHAVVAGKTRTATCRIRPPATTPAQINADLSYTPAAALAPIYDDTCRIQVINALDRQRLFGDEYQSTQVYLVAIDYAAHGIKAGCLVEVTESNDPDLADPLRLVVARGDLGSLRFERDLYCVDAKHQ